MLRCQAMTLIQQLAQAANVSLLEHRSKASTLEASKQAFSADYTRLCSILTYLTQEQEKHAVVRSGAQKALLAVRRLFDAASPPETERERASSMTVAGRQKAMKIEEEDIADPPTLATFEAAPPLPDNASACLQDASTEELPAAKNSKPASKSLLARYKSSKKGVKKALKKCTKVRSSLLMLPLHCCKSPLMFDHLHHRLTKVSCTTASRMGKLYVCQDNVSHLSQAQFFYLNAETLAARPEHCHPKVAKL